MFFSSVSGCDCVKLDGAGNAKLCDFGLAAEADVHLPSTGCSSRSLTASMRLIRPKEPLQPAGSPRYMPPELAAGGNSFRCAICSSYLQLATT